MDIDKLANDFKKQKKPLSVVDKGFLLLPSRDLNPGPHD